MITVPEEFEEEKFSDSEVIFSDFQEGSGFKGKEAEIILIL